MAQRQKGITQVVAVILLLMITITLSTVVYVFFSRTQQFVGNATQRQYEQQQALLGTKFTVDSVYQNRVYVRNLGTSAISGLRFYLNNAEVQYAGPQSVAPDTVGTYVLNDTQLAAAPEPVQLRVTGPGGKFDEITAYFYEANTVAYWKFDEGSGTIASDSTGKYNATLQGALWVPGVSGSAVDVNDTRRVSLGTVLSPSFTLSFWANADSYSSAFAGSANSNVAIAGEQYLTNGFRSGFDDQGRYYFWTTQSGGTLGGNATFATSPTQAGSWNHFIVTYNGTTARMYKNGVLHATAAGAYVLPVATMFIDGGTGGVLWFDGKVDEVRILDVARTMGLA